ncbi:MAG: glycosyltransferase family 39 protein [Anaerolineales bacterium]|nr:glycosyltransferase family 39 protein [Anaerolineales bacterium]
MNRKPFPSLYVWGIWLFGAGLRLGFLGKQDLFLDEAWSWATIRLGIGPLLRLSLADPHPPFYYLLLKAYLLLVPDTEFWLRALSAGISLASLWIVMQFTAERWGRESALAAGFMLAVSSFDIYYAQEARMYTLAGFLWLVSFVALLRALEGGRRAWGVWVVTNILMAWTHLTLLLVVFAYLLFLAGYVVRGQGGVEGWQADRRTVLVGMGLVLAGIGPAVWQVFQFSSDYRIGGAWIPGRGDLWALFLLWSTGLTAARSYFLDSSHLTLPLLAQWSAAGWGIAGAVTVGFPAVWGMYRAWQKGGQERAWVWVSLCVVLGPILLGFGYAFFLQRAAWAFKPFLGAGYLLWIWAGVGIGALPRASVRKGWGLAILLISAASLLPYFTGWQKSEAGQALRALPPLAAEDAVVVVPAYLAPLVFYYTPPETPLFSVSNHQTLLHISPSEEHLTGLVQEVPCTALSNIANLWIYGDPARIQPEQWPECVQEKQVWMFIEGGWK